MLKSLVHIHRVLRLKIGESNPVQSIVGRKRSSSEAQVGFKVGLRLIFDSRENEHDLLLKQLKRVAHQNYAITFVS